MDTTRFTSRRLSPEATRLVAVSADTLRISQAAVRALALHEKATREGVK